MGEIKIPKSLLFLLVLDLTIIVLHLFWGREIGFFNLDMEYNLPAYYSGLKLLIIGIISTVIYISKLNKV
jgi:hypothetical protein